MTGYAERRGEGAGHEWRWELRSLNGRGLDLRLRLPERVDGLEPAVRRALGARATRGSVTLSCRVVPRAEAEAAGRDVDRSRLKAALAQVAQVERAARDAGLRLAPAEPTAVLAMPGVVREARSESDADALTAALLSDLEALVEAWDAMRAEEGGRLGAILGRQLGEIDALADEAETLARAREPRRADALSTAVARLTGETPVDPDRLAQELALLAVRSDISEEIDRLRVHVAASRDLLAGVGPVGRKLDFLTQELAREANTICSKAQSSELTRAGLDLKAVVDRMREQVQNVE
jgi:uncharacterized protein (TIGR00255 family)